MIIAFIPARGGSERIQNKNLRPICGKPLIRYAIDSARESEVFDKVYVNSDSEEILSVAKSANAEAYKRPESLSHNKAFIIDVLKDMIKNLSLKDEDIIGTMLPTAPLVKPIDVLSAFEIFKKYNYKVPVCSVSKNMTPIQLAQTQDSEGRLTPVFKSDYYQSTRSTDHKDTYMYNETIIFNNVGNIKSQSTLIGESPYPYIMPPERALMIDYPFQLELAELIIKNNTQNQ